MTKPPESCHDFDVRSEQCRACDSWGECALKNPDQFKGARRK